MELVRNIAPGRFGLEGEVYFGLFDKYIKVSAEESTDEAYITRCARFLNELGDSVIDDLCDASIRYCNTFLSEVGMKKRKFSNRRDVLSLIDPNVLIVPEPENGDEPVVHLELDCDWESEHGMEWIVRGDKVLYVGAFHDDDPWRDFSANESYNYD